MPRAPEISVVIPVYNEAAILDTAVRALVSKLDALGTAYEIWLAENGSTDGTGHLAERLSQELPPVRHLHVREPNYGRALKLGILASRGAYVVCDEIDLGDIDFYTRALELLRGGADLVVGSKRHRDSRDARPWIRRQGTLVINSLLRLSVGFQGTDTHGPKAFRRTRLLPVVKECVVEHDLFASELVIRAHRAPLNVREIPLQLREIRPPSVGLVRRVPKALASLGKLVYAVRWKAP